MLTTLLIRLRRYWYVVVAGLFGSLLLSAAVLNSIPARYQATRSMLFVPSPTSELPDRPLNPFFSYINENLNTPIQVISIMVSDERVAEEVAPGGSGIVYSVGRNITFGAPVLEIEVSSPTADLTDTTADKLTRLVESTLLEQQIAAGGPESTWMKASLIASSLKPKREWSKPAQMAVAAFGIGMLAVFGVIAVLARRSERPQAPRSAECPPVDGESTESTKTVV